MIKSSCIDEWSTMLARLLQSLWREQEGSALVEAAVLLPILIVLLVGTYDFSSYFYQQHLISTGVRDAARYLARTSNPSDPTNQSNAKNLAATGQIGPGGTPRVSNWSASNIAIQIASDTNTGNSTPCGSAPCRGGSVIQVVTVCTGTTTATQSCSSTGYTPLTFGIFGILGLTIPIFNVSHSERVIGQS
jgi:Flp pilus assembly protein TadG